MEMTRKQLAAAIDHTLLKPEATAHMIDRLCEEALRYEFASVCVNPIWIGRCVERLQGSKVKVAGVAAFPLGASRTATLVDECRRAINDGAVEVDMVARIGQLIAGQLEPVTHAIASAADAVHGASPNCVLKVILETAALTPPQIAAGCDCAKQGGADYVKTSTGFHPAGGATIETVQLLHRHGAPLKVKAAGGIRDLDTALAMIDAGADRLGCSASVAIVEALPE